MFDADELKWLGETPRMATYRSGANGHSAAQIGLAAALIRGRDNTSTARTVAPAKPKASTSATGDRVKIVAEAVAKDSALKGKAGEAIAMLADPDLAGLTGAAVVKSLKAGVTASPPAPAASKAAASTRTAVPAPKAASAAVWDKAIASMGQPPKLAATKASMTAWDSVIGRMKGAH